MKRIYDGAVYALDAGGDARAPSPGKAVRLPPYGHGSAMSTLRGSDS